MKKGAVAGEMIYWVGRILEIITISLLIYGIVNIHLARSVKTNDIESDILESRLIYGGNCVLYNDGTRNNPGILDINKMNENQLNRCLNLKNKNLQGVNITLKDENGILVKEIILNKDIYDLKVGCNIKKTYVNCNSARDYVLYYDKAKLESGHLYVGVVTVNEQKG